MHQPGAGPKRGEHLGGGRQGRGIAVQTKQPAVGPGSTQQAGGMAARAHRSVNIFSAGPRLQAGEHFMVKNGYVTRCASGALGHADG